MSIKHSIQSALHEGYKALETNEHLLTYLFLEITRKCNLNCLHCGSDCRHDSSTPELTTESWIKIIHYVKERFSKSVNFIITGGEPLYHPDIIKIGEAIHAEGMRWGMVSNGLLIEKKIQQLVDAGIYSITLSLDGLKNTHNKLRNSPIAYNRIIKAIQVTGKSNVVFKDVVTCVYPDNINQLDEIANLLIDTGINSWRLFRIFPMGRTLQNPGLLLSFKQTRQLLDWIKSKKSYYEKKGLSLNLSCEGWLPFSEDKKIRDYPFFCRSGINIASILCNGAITGCSNNHESFHVGNILNEDFAKLWETRFEKFRNKEWLKNTYCYTCEHFSSCKGSSIHLWDLKNDIPAFCYVRDLSKLPSKKISPVSQKYIR